MTVSRRGRRGGARHYATPEDEQQYQQILALAAERAAERAAQAREIEALEKTLQGYRNTWAASNEMIAKIGAERDSARALLQEAYEALDDPLDLCDRIAKELGQ